VPDGLFGFIGRLDNRRVTRDIGDGECAIRVVMGNEENNRENRQNEEDRDGFFHSWIRV
jgi:hypothetical protein